MGNGNGENQNGNNVENDPCYRPPSPQPGNDSGRRQQRNQPAVRSAAPLPAPERPEYPFVRREIEAGENLASAQRKYTIFSPGALYHKKNFGRYTLPGFDAPGAHIGHFRTFQEFETRPGEVDWPRRPEGFLLPPSGIEDWDEFRFSCGKHWVDRADREDFSRTGGDFLYPGDGYPAGNNLGIIFGVSVRRTNSVANGQGYNTKTSLAVEIRKDTIQDLRHGNLEHSHDVDAERLLDHIEFKDITSLLFRGENAYEYDPGNEHHHPFARHHGSGLFREGHRFKDYVFSAPAPFLPEEANQINLSNYDKVSVKLKINNFYEETGVRELDKPSIYRLYRERDRLGIDWGGSFNFSNPCFEDRIQKFTCENVKIFSSINSSVKNLSDKYVEIKLSTPRNTDAGQALHDHRIDKYIMEIMTQTSPAEEESDVMLDHVSWRDFSSEPLQHSEINDRFKESVKIRSWEDLDRKIDNIHSPPPNRDYSLNIDEYPLHYEGYDSENPAGSKRLIKFWDSIRSQIFLSKLESMSVNPEIERAFGGILKGKKAYSEVIGYKICKYDVTNPEYLPPTYPELPTSSGWSGAVNRVQNELRTQVARALSNLLPDEEKMSRALQQVVTPIQEFYLMNSDHFGEIEFVDSQIVSNKKYLYEIFTINMVFGTEYEYPTYSPDVPEQFHRNNIGRENEAAIRFYDVYSSCRPVIKLAPYFQKILEIVDLPPVRPKISFLPVLGDESHFKVLLEASNHQEVEEPVKIFQSDEDLIRRMLNSEAARDDGKVLFKGDNYPKEYEIIKLSRLPSSYAEIPTIIREATLSEPARLDRPNYPGDNSVTRYASNGKLTILTLPVIPNKKYYYLFRAIDDSGISNPSRIYQLRLVSYQNGRFLEFKEVDFADPIDRRPLTMKRMLLLRPNFMQRTINFEAHDLRSRDFYVNAPFVNPEAADPIGVSLSNAGANSLWGRKFKLRIKSKSSQKSVDINFSFKEKKKYLAKKEKEIPEINDNVNCEVDQSPARRSTTNRRNAASLQGQGGSESKIEIKVDDKASAKQRRRRRGAPGRPAKDPDDLMGTSVQVSPKNPDPESGGKY